MTLIYQREPEQAHTNMKDIKTMVDQAFDAAVTESTTTPQVNQLETYKTPEDYRKATGRRFRITKEEAQRGLSREQAFEERAKAGKLEVGTTPA